MSLSPKLSNISKKEPLTVNRFSPTIHEIPNLAPSNVPVLEAYIDSKSNTNSKRMMAPKSKLFQPTIAHSLNYNTMVKPSPNYKGERRDPPIQQSKDDYESDDQYSDSEDDNDFIFPFLYVTQSQPIEPKITVKFRLQDFLEASPEGATILIPAGIYEDNLILRKRCNLVANGKVEFRGKPGFKEPTITIKGQSISMSGISIKSPNDAPAIFFLGTSAKLDNCSIESTENPAIFITGNCFASFNNCTIFSLHNKAILSDNGMIEATKTNIRDALDDDAVVLNGTSISRFIECKFSNCSKSAIKVNDRSVIILDSCSIETCGENGIFLNTNSLTSTAYYNPSHQQRKRTRNQTKPKLLNSTILQTTISDCGKNGIFCALLSAPCIIGCEISECREHAIVLNDGCGCVMKNNTIYRCGANQNPLLVVKGNASLFANGDSYSETGPLCIFTADKTQVTLNKIKFTNIKGTGLVSTGESILDLIDSTFNSISNYGVFFESQGKLSIRNCSFTDCQMGLVCEKCSNISILECNFDKCSNSGAQLNYVENIMIENSSFTNNQECGIFIQNSSNCSIENITISDNSFAGIDSSKSQISINKGKISDNLMGGICLRNGSSLNSGKELRIEKNGVVGVSLEGKSIASLSDSEIVLNSGHAFTVVRQSVLTISSSRITNHNDVALQIEGRASKLIADSCFIEHNGIALVSSDNAIVNTKSTSFNDNCLHVELRDSATMKSQFTTFTNCRGPVSVHVLSASSLGLVSCTLKENQGICLACAANAAISFCHFLNNKGPIAIILSSTSSNLSITGGSIESNGEVGIYIKDGTFKGNDTKIANHSSVGIIISQRAKATLSGFVFHENGLMNINRE